MSASLALIILGFVLADPPAPLPPTPSQRQIKWHERSMYAFVHFNMNTFTDKEWGHGNEDPTRFAPTDLDTDQWCRVFKAANLSGIIITAKHHDGFCLWPSAVTEHTVAHSSWRNGSGDILRDLSTSCQRYGLDFGVYLSPWDRNHPMYGTGAPYNEVFADQLREVLGNYGEVFEVWFDGACGEGPNGKRQVYDFPMFIETVRELQPNACIFSDAGPDVRWIGNERGIAGETNWSILHRDDFYPGIPGRNTALNQGQEDGSHWLPGEADVSIRPGWYYHAGEDDRVKNLDQLLEIWYGSVGRGANLLLNFPVDRRGLVHENDAAAAIALSRAIDAITSLDVALDGRITASHVRGGDQRFGAARLIDSNPSSYWAPGDGVTRASIELRFPVPVRINHVDLGEYLPLGQRVRVFTIEVLSSGAWMNVANATTIGNRRIVRIDEVVTDGVRVSILDARGEPTLRHLRVYAATPFR